jgi:polyribonucleotide nucleotidyltransferase
MGDQLLVKVIAVEGNKVRLSRKAVLRDQRAKTDAPAGSAAPTDLSKHPDHKG